jgi:tRNA pseudouridine13 synthase
MLTLSQRGKATGRIKTKPEDFVVEEITKNGSVLEMDKRYSPIELGFEPSADGNISLFIMQKKGWNTLQALKELARKLRRGIKSTGFAGTKDRMSISVQLCSIFGATPEELANVHLKDVSINGAWKASEKIKLGDLLGNRFTITARDVQAAGNFNSIAGELNGVFPNYFGVQRFGIRDNNVEIGVGMMEGDFEGAVKNFLTNTNNEMNEEAVQARKRLQEEMDFNSALQYFPQYLKYERQVIEHLTRFPGEYSNALRRLPRSLSLMFIHSVEAHIFNKELEYRISNGETRPKEGDMICYPNKYGFCDLSTIERYEEKSRDERTFIVGNVIGYDTKYISEFENKALDELGIKPESFKVKGMNELNSKGSPRLLFAPYLNLQHSTNSDDKSAVFRFSLQAGSYATVFLDEFISGVPQNQDI